MVVTILLNDLSSQRDRDFVRTSQGHYTSTDPRLISEAHNSQTLVLDQPPYNGKVDMTNFDEVYKPRSDYNLNPKGGWSSFTDGQVQYYITPSLAVPFLSELFCNQCWTPEPYVDPMGSVKPHYNLCTNQALRGPCQVRDPTELTWITDSTAHRESIMASQQARRNQERYDLQKITWL